MGLLAGGVIRINLSLYNFHVACRTVVGARSLDQAFGHMTEHVHKAQEDMPETPNEKLRNLNPKPATPDSGT